MVLSPTRRNDAASEPAAFGSLEPTDTAAATDGQPWEKLLAEGEEPARVIAGLARRIRADLKSWTGGTATILFDNGSKTVTLESRAPAPEGTAVFRASITLCVDSLTTENAGRRLSVLPRVIAQTLIWKDGVAWIAHGSENQFADYLQQIQQRLIDISL
jgi:hypothetical protein